MRIKEIEDKFLSMGGAHNSIKTLIVQTSHFTLHTQAGTSQRVVGKGIIKF